MCFSSFKFLKENFKSINRTEEFDMNYIGSLKQIANVIYQRSFHDFHGPIVCYMVDFNSQSFHPLINCDFKDEKDYELVSKPVMSLLPANVSLQHSYETFQPICDSHQVEMHGSMNAVGGLI